MDEIPVRRFGRTGIAMPILSLGGMRFQQSWTDLDGKQITNKSQQNLEKTLNYALKYGLSHIETARHYGTSERQIGWGIKKIKKRNMLLNYYLLNYLLLEI